MMYVESEWKFTAFTIGALTLLVALIVAGCAVLNNHSTHVSCLRLEENTALETRVARSGMTAECYIRLDSGQWIPADRYRGGQFE